MPVTGHTTSNVLGDLHCAAGCAQPIRRGTLHTTVHLDRTTLHAHTGDCTVTLEGMLDDGTICAGCGERPPAEHADWCSKRDEEAAGD